MFVVYCEEARCRELPECEFAYAMSQKYREEKAREQSYLAWALLAFVVKKEYGEELTPKEIAFTATGKPYRVGSPYWFSLSHSEQFAAVAVSDSPCGVDVESVEKVAKLLSKSSSSSFFQNAENGLPTAEKAVLLAKKWVKAEAQGKMTGEGIKPSRLCEISVSEEEKGLTLLPRGAYLFAVNQKGEEPSVTFPFS